MRRSSWYDYSSFPFITRLNGLTSLILLFSLCRVKALSERGNGLHSRKDRLKLREFSPSGEVSRSICLLLSRKKWEQEREREREKEGTTKQEEETRQNLFSPSLSAIAAKSERGEEFRTSLASELFSLWCSLPMQLGQHQSGNASFLPPAWDVLACINFFGLRRRTHKSTERPWDKRSGHEQRPSVHWRINVENEELNSMTTFNYIGKAPEIPSLFHSIFHIVTINLGYQLHHLLLLVVLRTQPAWKIVDLPFKPEK